MNVTDKLIRETLADLQYAGHVTTEHDARLVAQTLITDARYMEDNE